MFINRILIDFAKHTKNSILKVICLQTVTTFLSSVAALLIGEIVRAIVFSGGLDEYALKLIVFTLALMIATAAINLRKSKMNVKVGVEIKSNIRGMLLQKLFTLGPAYLSRKRTGELTSIMTSRVEWLMNYYVLYLPAVVSAILNSVIFVIFLAYVDIVTGIVASVASVAMVVIPMVFFKIMRVRGEAEWKSHARYYSDCLDGIQGIISLKALGADQRYVHYIKKSGESFRRAVMSHLKVTMTEGTFSEFFSRVGSAVTLAVLAVRLSAATIDLHLVILAFFAAGAAFAPMLVLINAWHMGFQGIAASYSIKAMLGEDMRQNMVDNAVPAEFLPYNEFLNYAKNRNEAGAAEDRATVEFRNVDFSYNDSDEFGLKDISFRIEPDRMLALVGSSGSGKTTIANLLAGFYRPKRGEILINGKALSDETVDYVRNMITAVWQDSHLFNATVCENISVGRSNASAMEVEDAGKKAEIHDFIVSLPEGYQTDIGENGKLFSTGERQRMAMARAFLKNSPILIFDEATSALDRESENKIQRNFNKLKEGKTVLVIAHRLQTILNADEICVVSNGRIVERGTHGELLKMSERYRKIMGEQLNAK